MAGAGTSRVWHPNTQADEWGRFPEIVRGDGMYLVERGGRRLLDGVASMWCNVWGHSRPELVRAMHEQAKAVPHSPLFNLTHGPAEELAGRLVGMAPGMHRAFFSDDGSTAMEAAVKMAIQYWANGAEGGDGARRKKIACLEGGYHGDTFGAMSVGYVPEFFSRFRGSLFRAIRFPSPGGAGDGSAMEEEAAQRCLGAMEEGLAGDDAVAALVMESGAQAAGGVRIYPPGFQRRAARLCRESGALLVLDEVATGLGRLGSMAEYAAQGGPRPDIVAYGKMLTGGCLPMAATLANKRVHGAFGGRFADRNHLFHGHTYTGNPMAAAAACENLRLYGSEGLLGRVRRSSAILGGLLEGARWPGGAEVRHKGLLAGVELDAPGGGASLNRILFEEGRRRGVYLRALGSIVMLVPPLAIGEADLRRLVDGASGAARAAAAALSGKGAGARGGGPSRGGPRRRRA